MTFRKYIDVSSGVVREPTDLLPGSFCLLLIRDCDAKSVATSAPRFLSNCQDSLTEKVWFRQEEMQRCCTR